MKGHVGHRIKGFAWFVYPDPATPGALEGDDPFGVGELGDERRAPGVAVFWALGDVTTQGIQNHADGRTYVAVTEHPEPPPVGPGWMVDPARLEEGFSIDQRGGRWARLAQVLRRVESRWGPVQEGDFEVDWT